MNLLAQRELLLMAADWIPVSANFIGNSAGQVVEIMKKKLIRHTLDVKHGRKHLQHSVDVWVTHLQCCFASLHLEWFIRREQMLV